jgi:FHS family L-fucose permease-like MFS transporter
MNAYLQGEANTVQIPYLIIGLVVLVVAVLFIFIRTPEPGLKEDGVTEKRNLLHALRHAHLRNGVIAQFFYVGAQVCVTSFFIRFAKYSSDVPEKSAAFWLSMAMLGFMLGRFIGTLLTRYIAPNRLLTLYSIIAAGLLGIAIVIGSGVAMWAIILVPFFESIMFPTIFSLAIQDLKEDTELGSSLVVMSIVGGAFAPLLMGWISDQSSIQIAYIVPLLCLLVVAWFGARGYKVVE